MYKICTFCNETKKMQDFYLKDSLNNRYHSHCKQCYKIKRLSYQQIHYEKYGQQYRERAKIRKNIIQKQRYIQLLDYLDGKSCEYCGFNDIRALEFDHIDQNTKSFGIARALSDCLKWETILAEINKCRLLCANCHRIRTAEQQNWYKWHLGRVVR